jgi:hypothetical protein
VADGLSDEEFAGRKGISHPRQAPGQGRSKKRSKESSKRTAWENYVPTDMQTLEEAEDGTVVRSVREAQEERKRKR